MPPTLRDLAAVGAAAASAVLHGDGDIAITGLACDPTLEDVHPGVLFAPLDLPPERAVALAARAIARGAVALLLEQPCDLPAPQLIVPSVRAALPHIAAAFYGFPATSLRCIGVTGTEGKTTTTFLIDAILREAGERPGLIGTLEWRAGDTWTRHRSGRTTPEAPHLQRLLRDMVEAGDQWATIEASSQGLALHRLDTVPFAIGAMTFITQDHLAFHGSVEAYRRAKAILFERVAENGGVAVINADDPAASVMRDHAGASRIITYSVEGRAAEVRATSIEPGPTGTRFVLSTPGGTARVTLPLLGTFNVANALCAVAVVHAVGIPLDQIARSLGTVAPAPGRLEPVRAGQPFLVLIDEAQSAAQVAGVIDIAHQLVPQGRVIVLVGGSDAAPPALLRQKGEVAALAADFSVFTTQQSRVAEPDILTAHLAAGARAAGGIPGVTYACVEDRRAAVAQALERAKPGDCVLLLGKADSDSPITGDVAQRWDEAAVARQVLAAMGHVMSNVEGDTRRGAGDLPGIDGRATPPPAAVAARLARDAE